MFSFSSLVATVQKSEVSIMHWFCITYNESDNIVPIIVVLNLSQNQDSSVNLVTRLQGGWLRKCGPVPGRDKRFASTLSLAPNWPPFEWLPKAHSPEVMWPGCVADHFCIMLRLRMSKAVSFLSHLASYHVQDQPCFSEVQLILRVSLICLAEIT